MFISTFEFLWRPFVEAMKVWSFTKNCVKSFFYIEFYNELIWRNFFSSKTDGFFVFFLTIFAQKFRETNVALHYVVCCFSRIFFQWELSKSQFLHVHVWIVWLCYYPWYHHSRYSHKSPVITFSAIWFQEIFLSASKCFCFQHCSI